MVAARDLGAECSSCGINAGVAVHQVRDWDWSIRVVMVCRECLHVVAST
jgi:hypothetical protein